LIEKLAEYERQIPIKHFAGNEFDDSIPIIPHLMSDSIGLIVKKSQIGVYECARMVIRTIDAIQAFDKN